MTTLTPRISEVASHLVVPEGIVSTAFPAVEHRIGAMGVTLQEWQRGAGKIILGKDENGIWAATVGGVVISIPRQVGKTFLIAVIVIALCTLHPGLTVIWTAHRTRTATNTFKLIKGLTKKRGMKRFMLRPRPYREANGEQEVRFANGSAILFGAREQGFGRGLDEVDILVFDEAQILTERAVEDLAPATNQSRCPMGALIIQMGTPPRPIDPSEVFTAKRESILNGTDQHSVYIECSADPDCDPDDVDQWATANPSYPEFTSHESMLRLRRTLGNVISWKREALGIWDAKASPRVVPAEVWAKLADATSRIAPDSPIAYGVDRDPGETVTTIAVAGYRADGVPHVEIVRHTEGDPGWVIPWIEERCVNRGRAIRAVVIDVASPAKALTQQLSGGRWVLAGERPVTITAPTVDEVADACSQALDKINAGKVRHLDQPILNMAMDAARKRKLRAGARWAWDRASAESDITPTVAVTNALWGLTAANVKRPYRTGGRAVARGSRR